MMKLSFKTYIFKLTKEQVLMIYPSFQKHISQPDQKTKFKKQCLKDKNILFQNEQIQIGCKVIPLYDFYSSQNYLQINLFIGNKTDRPLDSFRLDFRATPNLVLYQQQKTRTVKERTQYKERLVLGCNNFEEEILILMDFQSSLVTLRSTPLPITLFKFLIFAKGETVPSGIQTETDLQQFLEHKYEYIEQQEMLATSSVFKKAIASEFEKYFGQMAKICDGVLMGTFTTKTLLNEYVLVLKVVQGRKVKVCLGGNQYLLFQQIMSNIKFLLQ